MKPCPACQGNDPLCHRCYGGGEVPIQRDPPISIQEHPSENGEERRAAMLSPPNF